MLTVVPILDFVSVDMPFCDGRADCPNGEDESYYECWARKSTTARSEAFTRQVNPWDWESEKKEFPAK